MLSVAAFVRLLRAKLPMLASTFHFLYRHNHGQTLAWILYLVYLAHRRETIPSLCSLIASPRWHTLSNVRVLLILLKWHNCSSKRFTDYMVCRVPLCPTGIRSSLAIFSILYGAWLILVCIRVRLIILKQTVRQRLLIVHLAIYLEVSLGII